MREELDQGASSRDLPVDGRRSRTGNEKAPSISVSIQNL